MKKGHSPSPNDLDFDQAIERIKKATQTRTQIELAAVLGIRQSSISDAKRRQSIPADWLLKLFRLRGLNPDWLASGVLPVYLRHVDGQVPEADLGAYQDPQSPDLVRCRMVAAYPTAAPYQDCRCQHAPLTHVSIPENRWGESLLLVMNQSSGMEPVIRRRALVGVDTSQDRPKAGDIAAVYHPQQGLYFRQVYFDPDRDVYLLRAEVVGHPEQVLPAQNSGRGPFVGRVVWVWQEV